MRNCIVAAVLNTSAPELLNVPALPLISARPLLVVMLKVPLLFKIADALVKVKSLVPAPLRVMTPCWSQVTLVND